MLTRDNRSEEIAPKVLKRVKIDEGYTMIDFNLMALMTDEESNLMKMVKEEMRYMATINFNGSVDARGSIFGDNGTINNYNTVVSNIEQIKDVLAKIDDEGAKELYEEATLILTEKSDSASWREKLVKFKDKAIDYAKEISAVGKARDAIEGSALMDLLNQLSF